MDSRRFTILYQRERDQTLEREVVGRRDEALALAWQMLQDGRAKVAAIVEVGNLDVHIWHHTIVQWGREQAARAARRHHVAAERPAA